jgi:hypothetical protein
MSSRVRPLATLAIVIGMLAPAAAAHAYDPLTWYSVDGGGVAFTSAGAFRLGATIGQPDAGTLTGGAFVLHGGFWRGGPAASVGVAPVSERAPAFRLGPPVPNPVRFAARLSFELAAPAEARLRVFDVSGRSVRTVQLGRLAPGPHDHVWVARDDQGRALPAGLYFIGLEAGEHRAFERVLVLR